MHKDLEVDKFFEIFVVAFGIVLHELCKGLSRDIFRNDGPFSVDLRDRFDFRDIQSRLFNARLIERFVQDIGFGKVFVEHLIAKVSVAVNGLVVAYRNNSVKLHDSVPLTQFHAFRSKH